MPITRPTRRTIRRSSALVVALAVGAALSASAQAGVVEDAGPFSFACTNSLFGPNPDPVLVTVSGTFPDEVDAGEEFAVTEVVVVMDTQGGYSIGLVPGGGSLDFGAFGVVPLPAPDGGSITEGVSTYSIPEILLTAPDGDGPTAIALEAMSYLEYTALPAYTCTADPTGEVTSIDLATTTTTTTTTATSTTSTTTPGGSSSTTTSTPGGSRSTPPGAKALPGRANYTG